MSDLAGRLGAPWRGMGLLLLLGIGLAQATLAQSARNPQNASNGLIHQQAPPFVRTDLSGNRVDLRAYRGKVVVLNFWATWCAPCLEEMPRFAAWQKQYASDGLQVIGVSLDDDAEPVRRLVRKLRVNYPVLMGDEQLGMQYGGILGIPVTYLIDRQGQIRARFQGETDLKALESQIKELLGGN
jgi:thiol-disulfide isomerase/thioredoxin